MSEQMRIDWTHKNRLWIVTASTGLLSSAVTAICILALGNPIAESPSDGQTRNYLTTASKRSEASKEEQKYKYSFVRNTRHDGTDPISCLSGPWNDCNGAPVKGK